MPRRIVKLACSIVESVGGKARLLRTLCVTELATVCLLGVIMTPLVKASSLSRQREIFRLDADAELFAKEMASQNHYILDWFDLWYNHTKNLKHRTNRGYQLSVVMGNMELGEPAVQMDTAKVATLYENSFENNHRQASTMEISETKQVTKSSILETFHGFESNSTTTIEGGIPGFLKVSAGWGIEVIIHKVKTEVSSTTQQVSLSLNVTIPPKTRVNVRWIVTTTETHIPWTVKVTVRGKFVVQFRGTHNGQHQRIYSITDMARYLPELEVTGEDEVQYTASGVLKDLKAEKLDVRVREESIGRKKPPNKKRP
ncbi:uncharacterized protein LOC144149583 [Haemaphysalis longicornis]